MKTKPQRKTAARSFATGGSPLFQGWRIQQDGRRRRSNAGPGPEPEPEPGGVPAYIAAAADGFTSENFGVEWVTDGADADSGKVTSWPSLRGTLAMTLQTPAAATVVSGGAVRAISGEARGRFDFGFGDFGLLTLVKQTGTDICFFTMTENGVFSNYSMGSQFNIARQGGPNVYDGLTDELKLQWTAYGCIFKTGVKERFFINGVEQTTAANRIINYGSEQKFGFGSYVSGYAPFQLADFIIYPGSTTAAEMEAYTLEAFNRANP